MEAKYSTFNKKTTINIDGKLMDFSTAKIMGILNVTPDSFYDGGLHNTGKAAIDKVDQMLEEGMDILDIGAVSTKPGAAIVNKDEEIERLLPVIALVKKNFPNLVISVDTFRASVAQEVIKNGAHIINDIGGGTLDPEMYKTVGRLKVPYILMHIQGTPQNMQINPTYNNVVADVIANLSKKVEALVTAGVNDIIIDPGFGFGKTLEQNYAMLAQLKDFEMLEHPILVGVSRKSMINKVLNTNANAALNGTTALNAWALQNGANILRVHDVKEARQVVTLHQQLNAH